MPSFQLHHHALKINHGPTLVPSSDPEWLSWSKSITFINREPDIASVLDFIPEEPMLSTGKYLAMPSPIDVKFGPLMGIIVSDGQLPQINNSLYDHANGVASKTCGGGGGGYVLERSRGIRVGHSSLSPRARAPRGLI
ncbi:hypothetical protein EVAR_706_1 [Eumeta japonica]|uniref:Uncharacterized protein n=1 Tax=Eumeta variegata TaxID=151549 RepID=A0A4C1SBW8_EUMVA|nr:hypothetical protein EVAR_706_1 [Eumeta japonica]